MTHDSNSDKKNNGPEKESDLKKFLKKRSFIYLMCAVAFVVIVVPDMIAPSDLEKKLVENLENDEQNTAWQIIKSYKGANNEGFELFDLMIKLIEDAYPTEKILEHKDTILEISAVNKDVEYGVGFYEVYFTFQTYNDSKKYIWKVNILTEEISPVNSEARQMLNNVDYYD
tara:strand:- start:99 stop:611 length:513 start_codon:yes stop_codon:yes gene_type:complete